MTKSKRKVDKWGQVRLGSAIKKEQYEALIARSKIESEKQRRYVSVSEIARLAIDEYISKVSK